MELLKNQSSLNKASLLLEISVWNMRFGISLIITIISLIGGIYIYIKSKQSCAREIVKIREFTSVKLFGLDNIVTQCRQQVEMYSNLYPFLFYISGFSGIITIIFFGIYWNKKNT